MDPLSVKPATTLIAALAEKSGEKALEVAKEEATGFLKKLLGPSADAIGESFAVRFRERMFNNMVEVVARAKGKLKDAGLEPKEVPLKIIHPLLESATLEDDSDLQNTWANLLAGAASYSTPLYPAYINTLRQLSSEEVKFLKAVETRLSTRIAEAYKKTPPEDTDFALGAFVDLYSIFEESNGRSFIKEPIKEDYEFNVLTVAAIENMCRLGIISRPRLPMLPFTLETFGGTFLMNCMKAGFGIRMSAKVHGG